MNFHWDANATNFHANAFTFNNASRLVVIQKKATIFTLFILRTLRTVKNSTPFLAAVKDSVYQNYGENPRKEN